MQFTCGAWVNMNAVKADMRYERNENAPCGTRKRSRFVGRKNKERKRRKERRKKMILDRVTVEDCIENFYRKGKVAILNDGKLVDFVEEKIPTQTANPSGDNK